MPSILLGARMTGKRTFREMGDIRIPLPSAANEPPDVLPIAPDIAPYGKLTRTNLKHPPFQHAQLHFVI